LFRRRRFFCLLFPFPSLLPFQGEEAAVSLSAQLERGTTKKKKKNEKTSKEEEEEQEEEERNPHLFSRDVPSFQKLNAGTTS